MFDFKILLKLSAETLKKLSPGEIERNVLTVSTIESEELVKRNFTKLDRERNVHGSHFYGKEGVDMTRSKIGDGRGLVVVDSYKMAHKYYGGKVKPVRAKYLAIPAADEYFRRPPRSFGAGKLAFKKTRKGGGLLYEVKNPGKVAYWLVRSVEHKARPETLPKPWEVAKTAHKAAADYVKTI